jgi:hypothetical protein
MYINVCTSLDSKQFETGVGGAAVAQLKSYYKINEKPKNIKLRSFPARANIKSQQGQEAKKTIGPAVTQVPRNG